MNPLSLPLLADENIRSEVVSAMAEHGRDIRSVHEEGLTGASDLDIIRRAHATGRVVLTHDSDFGTLAIQAREPIIGIIYVRPGHIRSSFVLEMVAAIGSRDLDIESPFIVVAERRADTIRIRARQLSGDLSPSS